MDAVRRRRRIIRVATLVALAAAVGTAAQAAELTLSSNSPGAVIVIAGLLSAVFVIADEWVIPALIRRGNPTPACRSFDIKRRQATP